MFASLKKLRIPGVPLCAAALVVVLAALTAAIPATAAEPKQKTFGTPDAAVAALVEAAQSGDQKALAAIFGPEGKKLGSGDPVQAKREREQFLAAYQEKHEVVSQGDRATLIVGKNDWPLPIPLVKAGDAWHFDTAAGREEILNRRIGQNELNTIQVLLAIVDAEREYASQDRNGDGKLEYAMKFRSSPGKKDGLHWPVKEGEPPSPLGTLAANAVREGYSFKSGKPTPYWGYYYRILKSQGKDAPGGSYDYVVQGKMFGGFAVLAYPAKYGASGVMSFMVNHDGVVYEKDLGAGTGTAAPKITQFNPDKSWKKAP
jgi:DUF2950 family protein